MDQRTLAVAALCDAASRGDGAGVAEAAERLAELGGNPLGPRYLAIAAKAGSPGAFLKLVELGADPCESYVDSGGHDFGTPLHQAAVGDSRGCAESEREPQRNTPLGSAFFANPKGWAFRELLRLGADPNATVWGFMNREPILTRALRNDEMLAFEELLEHGADPNIQDFVFRCPILHSAVRQGNILAVSRLLKAGADPWAKDQNGKHAWDGSEDSAKTLVKLAAIDAFSDDGLPSESASSQTPRSWSVAKAAHRGEGPLEVERLFSLGADPNEVFQGLSALHWAASGNNNDDDDGNAKSVELLLAAGADPNVRAEQTLASPLHFACLYAREEVARKLLENGADPKSEDRRRQTPLHYLALGDKRGKSVLRVASALLDAGTDPFAENVDGKTAFDLAQSEWFRAKLGEEVTAKMERESLPRESSSAFEDATEAAMKAARDGGPDALVAALDAGADPSSGALFCRLIQRGRADLLKVVLDAGADLDRMKIRYGAGEHTPLEFAATHANPDVLEAVAEASSDWAFVQRSGARGWSTPVMSALRGVEDKPVNLQIVLDAGKKRGAWERESGVDALKEAAVEAVFGKLSLGLEMLLDAGADPDWTDEDGNPLLAIATERADVKCVAVLLRAGADPWAKDVDGKHCWNEPRLERVGNLVKRAALKKMSSEELPSE